MRQEDRHAAGERHVAFARQQALTREMDRDERGRARGLHVDARSLEIEVVRNARRQEILVVAGVAQEEQPDAVQQFLIAQDVVHHVRGHPRAAEHADRAGETLGGVARVFERFDRALEEVTVLRIHDRRVLRAEAEVRGVEHLHVLEHDARLDVIRLAEELARHAGGFELFVAERAHRFDAVAHVAPVLRRVARARKTARHPDDGDVGTGGSKLGFQRLGIALAGHRGFSSRAAAREQAARSRLSNGIVSCRPACERGHDTPFRRTRARFPIRARPSIDVKG